MKTKNVPLSKQSEKQLEESLTSIINEFSFNPCYEVLKPALNIVTHIIKSGITNLEENLKDTCNSYSKKKSDFQFIAERQIIADIKRKEQLMDYLLFIKRLDGMLKNLDATSKKNVPTKGKITSKVAKKILATAIAADKAASGKRKPCADGLKKGKAVKPASQKVIDHTGGNLSGKVLTGLKEGNTVMLKGKPYIFVEYRDEGFTAMIKLKKRMPFLVFASELSLPKI